MNTLTIATPFYNEEEALENFFNIIIKINNLLSSKIKLKFLFIDDGSSDNTNLRLREFINNNKKIDIKIFSHKKIMDMVEHLKIVLNYAIQIF